MPGQNKFSLSSSSHNADLKLRAFCRRAPRLLFTRPSYSLATRRSSSDDGRCAVNLRILSVNRVPAAARFPRLRTTDFDGFLLGDARRYNCRRVDGSVAHVRIATTVLPDATSGIVRERNGAKSYWAVITTVCVTTYACPTSGVRLLLFATQIPAVDGDKRTQYTRQCCRARLC